MAGTTNERANDPLKQMQDSERFPEIRHIARIALHV
jgi:hypothetical protein